MNLSFCTYRIFRINKKRFQCVKDNKGIILIQLFCIISLLCSFSLRGQSYSISPIPVNCDYRSDFAPFVEDSVLYFSSNRKHEFLKSYKDQNNEELYRIYKVKLFPDDKFGKESLLHSEYLDKLNTSSISFAKEDSVIVLTKNIYPTVKRTKGKENLLGIFIVDNSNGRWKRPTAFPYNSRHDYSLGQPSLSDDGTVMFFVSNQPGGYGETDIYQSQLINGEWSEPKNLGPQVNTSGRELFPFYHKSGKLYFSSDQHNSKGKLDIFYTTWDGKGWTTPIALDAPVNSSYDDFSCYVYADGKDGFFTSNRNGCDNIYKCSELFPTFKDAKPQVEDNYCFTLFDNGPYQSDTLPYIYKWTFGDGETEVGQEVRHCFPGPGSYTVDLNVVDTLINQDLFTVAEYPLELKQTKQVYISAPDTVALNEPVQLSAEKSVLEEFKVKQYYWDLGDGTKSKGMRTNHIYRKTGKFILVCGVVSIDGNDKMSSTKTIIVTE